MTEPRTPTSRAARLLVLLVLAGAAGAASAAPFAYVTDHYNDAVVVVDTATEAAVARIQLSPNDRPVGVAISPDGKRLYTGNHWGRSVSVIDTATNEIVARLTDGTNGPHGIALNPAGTRLYVTEHFAARVSVFDTATLARIASIPTAENPVGIAVTPDGKRVYMAGYNGRVSVIDAAANVVLREIPVPGWSVGVAISPDGSKIYVANHDQGRLAVIDAATDQVTYAPVTSGGYGPYGVTVHPCGTRIYIGSRVLDARTLAEIAAVPGMESLVNGMSTNHTGTTVYAGMFATGDLLAIDTATNTVRKSIPLGANNPLALGNFVSPVPCTKQELASLTAQCFATGAITNLTVASSLQAMAQNGRISNYLNLLANQTGRSVTVGAAAGMTRAAKCIP